jgi:subtilisin-like proprotein convertase family protein
LEAVGYDLEIATDALFTNVVYTASDLTTTSHTPSGALDPSTLYFWRVAATNVCGEATSASRTFTTVLLTCETFNSTNVPLRIPAGAGTSGTTVSTLSVSASDGGTIADVNVRNLAGTHTYMGDLDFKLGSPDATVIEVMSPACGTAENFDLDLDDEAAPGAWPCPPTDGGTYRPSNPLAGFLGEDSTGTWTLTITDNAAQDIGELQSWGLEICIELPDDIFADGFESGNTAGWSITVP